MLTFSLVAAAAVATQPLPPETEADMRCFEALLYAVGTENADKARQSLLLTSATYYVGRLNIRLPGEDWTPHLRRLGNDKAFFQGVQSEISRCSVESGKAMQVAGTAAQNAAKPQ
ncbi:MAG: hypothetical protein ACKOOL_10900 [Novosphingobium sp.]